MVVVREICTDNSFYFFARFCETKARNEFWVQTFGKLCIAQFIMCVTIMKLEDVWSMNTFSMLCISGMSYLCSSLVLVECCMEMLQTLNSQFDE